MKKILICAAILCVAGCTFGGSVSAGGGSNGAGVGIGLGTGFKF